MSVPDFPAVPFPLVEVKWYDAAGDNGGWIGEDNIPHSLPVRTTGYLIHEDEFEVIVAAQWGPDNLGNNEYGGTQAIPKGMGVVVRHIEPLEVEAEPDA